jgi:hypothetical protein
MNAAADKRRPVCGACDDGGLIYPKPGQRGSLISLPARAMPLPCVMCEAGMIEQAVWAQLHTCGTPTPEIEIYRYRKRIG